jgi:hypothetical protein
MNRIAAGLLLACVASPSLAATYTSLDDFSADPLAAGLVSDDFEAATRTGDVISFGAGTITCAAASPVTYCPPTPANTVGNVPFFGLSRPTDVGIASVAAITNRSGLNAPYFSSPDTIVFSFAAPITAFGVFVGGLGDLVSAPTTLSGVLSTGETFTAFADYTSTIPETANIFAGNLFFGITSATPFTTIRFTGSGIDGDGIFFDDMAYAPFDNGGGGGDPEVIPLPASGVLLLAGIAGLAAVRRRRAA